VINVGREVMRIGTIIQARMSSARLPGKVLLELAGKPMLQRVIERVQAAPGSDVVAVATSTDASDDAISAFCKGFGVRCVRGPLDHVAERMALAAEQLALDAFVRVCADSPLIDTDLVHESAGLMRAGGAALDLVTNVLPRTFPPGQSVEVIRTRVLRDAVARMEDADEREHVTLHFYRRPARFCVQRMVSPMENTDVSMAVDEPADLLRLEKLFADAGPTAEEAGWMELAQHLRFRSRAGTTASHPTPSCIASASSAWALARSTPWRTSAIADAG